MQGEKSQTERRGSKFVDELSTARVGSPAKPFEADLKKEARSVRHSGTASMPATAIRLHRYHDRTPVLETPNCIRRLEYVPGHEI